MWTGNRRRRRPSKGGSTAALTARIGHLGRTPLHQAAFDANPALAAVLLDRGAAVNARNEKGETPLHEAAGQNNNLGGRRPAGGPGGRSHRAGSVRQDALGRMEPRLDEAPSVYFQRQFWATFEDDRAGILTREMLGVDRLMWGADYPHTEGTFPRSQEQIARDFAGIPEDEVYQMVVGNAAKLYGLEVLS